MPAARRKTDFCPVKLSLRDLLGKEYVDAVTALMTTNGGFFQENMHVALMRYGHDPDPDSPDTPIPMDQSGLLDGQSLDVPWYDPDSDDKSYFDCNGQDLIDQ